MFDDAGVFLLRRAGGELEHFHRYLAEVFGGYTSSCDQRNCVNDADSFPLDSRKGLYLRTFAIVVVILVYDRR
jgi:hypothetical protein